MRHYVGRISRLLCRVCLQSWTILLVRGILLANKLGYSGLLERFKLYLFCSVFYWLRGRRMCVECFQIDYTSKIEILLRRCACCQNMSTWCYKEDWTLSTVAMQLVCAQQFLFNYERQVNVLGQELSPTAYLVNSLIINSIICKYFLVCVLNHG